MEDNFHWGVFSGLAYCWSDDASPIRFRKPGDFILFLSSHSINTTYLVGVRLYSYQYTVILYGLIIHH